MSILLLAFAFFMLSRKNKPFDLSSLGNLSEGASNILNMLSKDGKGINMASLLELLSNPLVMSVLEGVLGKSKGNSEEVAREDTKATDSTDEQEVAKESPDSAQPSPQDDKQENSEETAHEQPNSTVSESVGTNNEYSQDKEEFFAPVEQMLTPSVTAELYKVYDNWYGK